MPEARQEDFVRRDKGLRECRWRPPLLQLLFVRVDNVNNQHLFDACSYLSLKAAKTAPQGGDFVWDGKDEDDRPATHEELQTAVTARKLGRPSGTGTKEQVALRLDRVVLAAFRNGGPGWQTQINDAPQDWLRQHAKR